MKKRIGLILMISLLMGCNSMETTEEENRYPMYKQAYLEINEGNYDEAIEILKDMRDYLDSEDLYYEAVYRRLSEEADTYFLTQEGFDPLVDDYLILSYDNRNQAMQDQQGLYLELLIISTKIHLDLPINCEKDFYYYQPDSFWDNFESVTVLNSEQLKEVIRAYRTFHEKDCVLQNGREEE